MPKKDEARHHFEMIRRGILTLLLGSAEVIHSKPEIKNMDFLYNFSLNRVETVDYYSIYITFLRNVVKCDLQVCPTDQGQRVKVEKKEGEARFCPRNQTGAKMIQCPKE